MKKIAVMFLAVVFAFALSAVRATAQEEEWNMIDEISAELCSTETIPTIVESISMFYAYLEYDESTGMTFEEFSDAIPADALASVEGAAYADCAVTNVMELDCSGSAAIIAENNSLAVEDVLATFDALGIQACVGFQVESIMEGNEDATVDVYLVGELEDGNPYVMTTLVAPEE